MNATNKTGIVVLGMCVVVSSTLEALFEHDRAASAAQKGDWPVAQNFMTMAMTNNPDKSDVIYDAGVAAYRTKQFSQAYAYFSRVASDAQASPELQERAHFNAGNTCVDLKKLPDAITHYEKALALNGANERTKHNLEMVKKMLEEQKQQEQQDQENKENNNDENNQDKQSQKDSEDKKNKEDKQNGSDQKDNKQNQQGKDDKQRGNQKDGNDQKKPGSQQKDNQQASEKNDKKDDARNGLDNKKEQAQQEQKKSDVGSKEADERTKKEAAAQEAGNKKDGQYDAADKKGAQKKQHDAWLEQVLKESEDKDAKMNKAMMKSMVGNQLVGQDGQNCW